MSDRIYAYAAELLDKMSEEEACAYLYGNFAYESASYFDSATRNDDFHVKRPDMTSLESVLRHLLTEADVSESMLMHVVAKELTKDTPPFDWSLKESGYDA